MYGNEWHQWFDSELLLYVFKVFGNMVGLRHAEVISRKSESYKTFFSSFQTSTKPFWPTTAQLICAMTTYYLAQQLTASICRGAHTRYNYPKHQWCTPSSSGTFSGAHCQRKFGTFSSTQRKSHFTIQRVVLNVRDLDLHWYYAIYRIDVEYRDT